jgi:lipopolysaccharide heptosyltransferase II
MDNLPIDKSKVHKILVIKPRAIGDVLLSTPVLQNLRREFPTAQIDFFVEKFAVDVLKDNPFIDNVVVFDPKHDSSVFAILKVTNKKYDIVIDLFANPRTAIITLLSGARYRVGFPFKWRRIAYNIIVQPRSGEVHNVEFNLDALRRLKIPIYSKKPLFYLNNQAVEFAERFLSTQHLSNKKFITIDIGGGWETKRLPPGKYIELSNLIHTRLNLPVVVLYGPSEADEAKKIVSSSKDILAPPTSLHEMGAIMARSFLLITNDSGPMHIAAALGVPTLAIFGPTSPRLQGPYGNISEIVQNTDLDCLECNLTKCPVVNPSTGIANPCMREINVEAIFESLLRLISRIQNKSQEISLSKSDKQIGDSNEGF